MHQAEQSVLSGAEIIAVKGKGNPKSQKFPQNEIYMPNKHPLSSHSAVAQSLHGRVQDDSVTPTVRANIALKLDAIRDSESG